MRWYADNSELNGIKEAEISDIHIMGGIIVSPKSEKLLRKVVEDTKGKYGYHRAPVKWNFRDLQSVYKKHDQDHLYTQLIKSSKKWRRDIFEAVSDYDFHIILSVIEGYSPKKAVLTDIKEDLTGYVFSNGLMRYAMLVKSMKPARAEVILDWPDGKDPTPFNKEYRWAYMKGRSKDNVSYFSGPLKDLNFHDSVVFTTMLHSTLLQLSDMVVGATRDFIKNSIGKSDDQFGIDMLKLFLPKFVGYPKDILGRGLNINSGASKVKDKIDNALKTLL